MIFHESTVANYFISKGNVIKYQRLRLISHASSLLNTHLTGDWVFSLTAYSTNPRFIEKHFWYAKNSTRSTVEISWRRPGAAVI